MIITAFGLYFTVILYMSTDIKTMNAILSMIHCHNINNGIHNNTEDCLRAILKRAAEM